MSLNFNKQAKVGNEFLEQLAHDLGNSDDLDKAGRIFTAVVHAIRDQLTLAENAQLLSQLPMILKGVYVHNWTPQKNNKPRIHSIEEFIDVIKQNDLPTGQHDFGFEEEAKTDIVTVISALKQYISEGEQEDIKAVLPRPLKTLWDEEGVTQY